MGRTMQRSTRDIQLELTVLSAQDGSEDALRNLVSQFQPRLLGLAWRMTGCRDATQEVVQQTWLAIVKGLHRVDDPASFRTWAFRIVARRCADWTRQRVRARRTDSAGEPDELPSNLDEAATEIDADSDEVRILRKAIMELPAEQRAALTLHHLEGLPVREIGEILDIPAGTVKSRLHNARQRLKEIIQEVPK